MGYFSTKNRCYRSFVGLFLVAAMTTSAVATVIRPQDFGGIGDGVHNDTVAMRKAVAACSAHGGCVLEINQGLVFLTGPISLPSNSRIMVAGTLLAAPIQQVIHISADTFSDLHHMKDSKLTPWNCIISMCTFASNA